MEPKYLNPDGTIKASALPIIIPEFKFAVREDIEDIGKFLPTKAKSHDTGWDVRCAEPDGVVLEPFDCACIPLGIRMYAPEGWWLELRPRSSTHAKKHLNCLYGVIDEGYENELLLSCQWLPPLVTAQRYCGITTPGYPSEEKLIIEYGERIGQVRPINRELMAVSGITNEEFDNLCKIRNGERGTGGFGSTG
jgi:dUTPase